MSPEGMAMAVEPPQAAQPFIWGGKAGHAELESEEAGFVHGFRSSIQQPAPIFDHSHSETQAQLRLQQLRQKINTVDDAHKDDAHLLG